MDLDLPSFLTKPLSIGNEQIQTRLVLAPMTGLGHIAFRKIVSSFGGSGLLFSEMCSAKALPHENRQTSPVFKWRDEEASSLVCQIFGSDPGVMAAAAGRIEDEGFFGVDINFGCSAAAICRQGGGAELLKNPSRAVKIVAAVRKAVSIPLFVKFRTGWVDDPNPAVDLAERFEDAGADALTFHPRVSPDRRSRTPKWQYIGEVKKKVSIPVFGNGDVFDRKDCKKMLETTGCDGVAIGRIAVAKPWIFSMWTAGFEPGPDIYQKSAMEMADLLEQHYTQVRAVKLFKKFATYFTAGFRFGHNLNKQLCRADSMEDIRGNIIEAFGEVPELASRPNMNMFTA